MAGEFLRALRSRVPGKKLLVILFLCSLAGLRPSAAQTFTVSQGSITPAAIPMTTSFTFTATLNSLGTYSNTIVSMDIEVPGGTAVIMQQYVSGQNFVPGQSTAYSWTGTIPPGSTFTAGNSYVMKVFVFSSGWGSQILHGTVAATFTVTATPAPPVVTPAQVAAYSPPPTNVGNTATPPIAPPTGTGHTYYVSDPSNASVNSANLALLPAGATVYTTVQAASNVTQPGDTVLIMNGTYQTSTPASYQNAIATITNSGSASGGYITYAAYPGAHPILTSANAIMWDVIQIKASYIVIQGLEIVGDAQNVTLDYANQTTQAEESVLAQAAAAGQPATYPSSNAEDYTNGNCIAAENATHLIIVNNLIRECSAAGIDFETCDYSTIEANTVYDTAWWTMFDPSGIDLHLALNSDSSTGYKNYILDNISYNSGNTQPYMYDVYANDVTPGSAPTTPTDGNGIIIDTNTQTNNGSAYLGRTLIAGNITYNNGGVGITAFHSNHVDMINNTAYMNNVCPVSGSTCGSINKGQLIALMATDINIYDNVLVAPKGDLIYSNNNNTSIAENNNIFYSPGAQNTYSASGQLTLQSGYVPAAQDLTSNPNYSSSTPASNNFLFAAGGPGLDAGISFSNLGVSVPSLLGLVVTNNAVDIGSGQ